MTSTASLAQGEIRTYANGSVVIRFYAHQVVGFRVELRKNGVMVEGHTETFETVAAAIYRRLVAEHRTAEESYTAALPNGVSVTLTSSIVAGAPIHRVETVQGGVVQELTASFGERHRAVEAAARVAAALRTHGSVEAIERRANALRFEVRDLLNARRLNRTRLAAVERELDLLADLQTYVPALAAA
jgi:hypothetical protein